MAHMLMSLANGKLVVCLEVSRWGQVPPRNARVADLRAGRVQPGLHL